MLFLAMFFWPISVPLAAGYVYLVVRTIRKNAYGVLAIVALAPFAAYQAFLCLWYLQVLPQKIRPDPCIDGQDRRSRAEQGRVLHDHGRR